MSTSSRAIAERNSLTRRPAANVTVMCAMCGKTASTRAAYCPACGSALAYVYRPLQPGQRVRNYTVERLLSKGGMGAVYLAADHAAFDRTVVIKELLDYFDHSDPKAVMAARERFRDEARTLASLRHPGIPQIFTFFSHEVSNYMVLEYIEGETVEQRLLSSTQNGATSHRSTTTIRDVVRWGIGLCRVLEYLAQREPAPVVHHDIKPANLVLDANTGEMRLVDFGTARARLMPQPGGGVGRQKSSIYGTVGYAPPEQYQGVSEPRSDVYALAATLYHMLTNHDPRTEPFSFPRLDTIPPRLRAALVPALEHDVAQRYTATQFRHALEQVAESSSPRPAAPTSTSSAPPAVRVRETSVVLRGHTDAIRALAWRPDGSILASAAADRSARLWDIQARTQRHLTGHADEVLSIAWHPGGNLLASGTADGTIYLWHADGIMAAAIGLEATAVAALAWHPSGAPLASGTADQRVHLWRRDPSLPGALEGHTAPVLALAWSPDGNVLATGAADGALFLWHVQSGKHHHLRGHTGAISALAWSPDGRAVASASADGTVQIWPMGGGKRRILRGRTAAALAWSPDGKTIATGGLDSQVLLWNSAGAVYEHLTGHEGPIHTLGWHPSSLLLASGSEDTTIRLWTLAGSLK